VERVGHLFGGHFLLTSNRRYLLGNFNGHLENCILFVLDEAFWSGDKQAAGTLKDLITGQHHVIEHKGKEPYTVDNRTRVAIIGNEDWIVPASHDERRFAVFDVGDGRKQDRAFFRQMREGMDRGGYRLLLRYLQNFSLEGIDLDAAPATAALADQKHATLEPIQGWWLECLTAGTILGGDFSGGWPEQVECVRFREAFYRYSRGRSVRSRLPGDRDIGVQIKQCVDAVHKKVRVGAEFPWFYLFPPLDKARDQWDKYIGHSVDWSA
jgi:hypothetical protein